MSKSSSTTRTAASGKTAITSRERPATAPMTSLMALRTTSGWSRFASVRSGTTLPGANSRAEQVSTVLPFSAIRPASTRSAEISQATLGLARILRCDAHSRFKSAHVKLAKPAP